MAAVGSYRELFTTFGNLLQAVENVNEYRCTPDLTDEAGEREALAIITGTSVLGIAQRLSNIALQFRSDICNSADPQSAIQTKEIPFDMLVRIVDIAAFNRRPDLKHALSKTAHVFAEIIVFQYQLQKEADRFDAISVQALSDKLGRSIDILHYSRIETRFHLTCVKEAIRMLDIGAGRLAELRKAHLKPAIIAGLQTILSITPTPPFINAAPLAPVLVSLVSDVYQMLRTSSYGDVWALRWKLPREDITSLKQLDELVPFTENYQTNSQLSICIIQIFQEIMKNITAKPELKRAVFSERQLSLISLTKHESWEVKYYALDVLNSLELDNSLWQKRADAVLHCWGDPNEVPVVKQLAENIAYRLAPQNQNEWKKLAQSMGIPQQLLDAKAQLDKAAQEGNTQEKIQSLLEQYDHQQAALEKQPETINRSAQKQSTESTDTSVDNKAPLKTPNEIEELRKTALKKKETLECLRGHIQALERMVMLLDLKE